MNHKNDHKHNNKSSGCCDKGEAKKPEKDNVKKQGGCCDGKK